MLVRQKTLRQAKESDLRAGSVDRGIVGLCVGRSTGSRGFGILGATAHRNSESSVGSENAESKVLVEDLAACK